MRKVIYKQGDVVGNCSFYGDEKTELIASRMRRTACFVCPYCESIFKGMVDNVKRGVTKSCGCLFKKVSSDVHKKHGASLSIEYRIWIGIKSRCSDLLDDNYGGRGIRICERWETSFENFIADMGKRPSAKHSVERKDNDKGYYPSNCVWATPEQQHNNKRTNILITHNGDTKTVMQWSKILSVPYSTIKGRVKKGWSVNDIFNIPFDGRNKFKRLKNKSL